MTDETILPCPWCGKPPRLARWPARIFDAVPARDMVTCENKGDDSHPRCPLEGSFMELAAWNRRAPSVVAPDASERDVLAKLIGTASPTCWPSYVEALDMADAILAAGFRAPRDEAKA